MSNRNRRNKIPDTTGLVRIQFLDRYFPEMEPEEKFVCAMAASALQEWWGIFNGGVGGRFFLDEGRELARYLFDDEHGRDPETGKDEDGFISFRTACKLFDRDLYELRAMLLKYGTPEQLSMFLRPRSPAPDRDALQASIKEPVPCVDPIYDDGE